MSGSIALRRNDKPMLTIGKTSQRDREFEMGYLNSVMLGYLPGAVRVGSNATGLLFLPRSHPRSVSSIRCCATHPPHPDYGAAAAVVEEYRAALQYDPA